MKRRTTLEIDESLLARAKKVLGRESMRETIEEALRLVVERGENEDDTRRQRQLEYFNRLAARVDTEVLLSEGMWR